MASLLRARRLDRIEAAAVVVGAASLVGSWVVVTAQDAVPDFEVRTFELVNDLPDAVWPVVWGPMQLGSFAGSLIVVGAGAAITRDRRLTAAALLSSQGAYWTAKAVKTVVTRGRPEVFFPSAHLREHAGGFGYVSGHAAVAFALTAALAPSARRGHRRAAAVLATVLASTVGFGRIYSGAHLPLDVVGGAGIGLLLGTLARWGLGLGGEGLPVRPIVHDL